MRGDRTKVRIRASVYTQTNSQQYIPYHSMNPTTIRPFQHPPPLPKGPKTTISRQSIHSCCALPCIPHATTIHEPSTIFFPAINHSHHSHHPPFPRHFTHLEPALQAGAERVELLDVRPVSDGKAAVLEADHLLGGLVLADRRKQLPERSPLLLLGLPAQLHKVVSL